MTDIVKDFDVFINQYPEKIAPTMLEPATLKKIATKVSIDYITFLKEHGIAGYDKGFIWSVNPLDYKDVVSDWPPLEPEQVHVVARTAFGDLFLWTGEQVLVLQVNHKKLYDFGESIPFLYDFMLTNERYMRKTFYRDMFDEAFELLGPLEHDECYGFSLVLSLGGPESVNNLQKVKLKPYLSIVAQA